VATEQGYEKGVRHVLRYALYPHQGDWREARVWEQGHGFNTPLLAVKQAPHAGDLPRRHSWCAVDCPTVVLSAVRRGARGTVIRVYEASGAKLPRVNVQLGFDAREVFETDMVERGAHKIPDATRRGFSFPLSGFQVKTFEIVG
jgi:alpha-mannosidase